VEKIGFKMEVKKRVIDNERGDATEEVEVREAEKEKSEVGGKVDGVKE